MEQPAREPSLAVIARVGGVPTANVGAGQGIDERPIVLST